MTCLNQSAFSIMSNRRRSLADTGEQVRRSARFGCFPWCCRVTVAPALPTAEGEDVAGWPVLEAARGRAADRAVCHVRHVALELHSVAVEVPPSSHIALYSYDILHSRLINARVSHGGFSYGRHEIQSTCTLPLTSHGAPTSTLHQNYQEKDGQPGHC